MALDTSGFNFAIPQQGIVTPALANIAPYAPNFKGMDFKPFDIKPPSTAVAQGIAAALGSIGQGIQVAYTNARQDKLQKQKDEIEQQKLGIQSQKEQAMLGIEKGKLGVENARLQWQMQHGDQVEQDKLALASRKQDEKGGVNFLDNQEVQKGIEARLPSGITKPKSESQWNLYTHPQSNSEPENKVNFSSPDLSLNKEPSQDISVFDGLKNITPESIQLNYTPKTASIGTGGIADVPSAVTRLVADQQALNPPTQGDFVPSQLDAPQIGSLENLTSPSPASLPTGSASTQPSSAVGNALLPDMPAPGPYASLKAAQEEANRTIPGYEPKGTPKFDKTVGGYIVERPAMKQETLEAIESRKAQAERQSVRTQMNLKQLDKATEAGLADQNKTFNNNDEAKKLRSQHRLLSGFLSSFKTGEAQPGAANITDLDLIDNYVAFARGAGSITGGGPSVTEAQYNEIKNARDIPSKIALLFGKGYGAAKLSPQDRKAMLNTMYESYNDQSETVNGQIEDIRDHLKRTHPDLNEVDMPHEYPVLRTSRIIEEDMSSTKEKATQIGQELKALDPNNPDFKAKRSEFDKALAELQKLKDESETFAKTQIPSNIKDFKKKPLGKRAGWTPGLFGRGSYGYGASSSDVDYQP